MTRGVFPREALLARGELSSRHQPPLNAGSLARVRIGPGRQLFYEFKRDNVIPKDHLLRRMNVFVTGALAELHQGLSK